MYKNKAKKFDQDLYDKYDKAAKEYVFKFFKDNKTYSLKLPENEKEVDLEIYKDGNQVAYMELEVKTNWDAFDIPFPNIQYLYKKEKYTTLDKPTIFVLFNHNLTNHLVFTDTDLATCPVKGVANKYRPDGSEEFFIIPKGVVRFNGLEYFNRKVKDINEESKQFSYPSNSINPGNYAAYLQSRNQFKEYGTGATA